MRAKCSLAGLTIGTAERDQRAAILAHFMVHWIKLIVYVILLSKKFETRITFSLHLTRCLRTAHAARAAAAKQLNFHPLRGRARRARRALVRANYRTCKIGRNVSCQAQAIKTAFCSLYARPSASCLTGDARPRFFESYALLEEQVRRARSDDGRL